jgi:hypothetical protein
MWTPQHLWGLQSVQAQMLSFSSGWTGRFFGVLLHDQIALFQAFGFLSSTSVLCRFDPCFFLRMYKYSIPFIGGISHPGTIWELVQEIICSCRLFPSWADQRFFLWAEGRFSEKSPRVVSPFPFARMFFVVSFNFGTNTLISTQI